MWYGIFSGVQAQLQEWALLCQRPDNTKDEAGQLAVMTLTASRVSYEPHIFYGMGMTLVLRLMTPLPPTATWHMTR